MVEWEASRHSTKKSSCTRRIWAVRLASKTDPNRNSNVKERSMAIYRMLQRIRSHQLRDGAYIPMPERRSTMGMIKKLLLKWGESNTAAPKLITTILHNISSWHKGHPPPPHYLTTPSIQSLQKPRKTGWIQALMV